VGEGGVAVSVDNVQCRMMGPFDETHCLAVAGRFGVWVFGHNPPLEVGSPLVWLTPCSLVH
jgi:hypothetical protein